MWQRTNLSKAILSPLQFIQEPETPEFDAKLLCHQSFTDILQGNNISHLGKRKIIFKMPFLGDMLVPWRVSFCVTAFSLCSKINLSFSKSVCTIYHWKHQLLIPEHHKNIKTPQTTKFTKGPHPPKTNTQIIQSIHKPPQTCSQKKNKKTSALLRRVSTNVFFFRAKYRR